MKGLIKEEYLTPVVEVIEIGGTNVIVTSPNTLPTSENEVEPAPFIIRHSSGA